MNKDKIINNKLKELSNSKFRSSFKLKEKDINYLKKKGLKEITNDAYEFINNRLAPSYIPNDGRQTPTKNHPVFIAQHATATCCRGCLEKWHHIPKNKPLSPNEINYIVYLIIEWIKLNKGEKNDRN